MCAGGLRSRSTRHGTDFADEFSLVVVGRGWLADNRVLGCQQRKNILCKSSLANQVESVDSKSER